MIKKFFLYLINDIFHGDDISETDGWFIMELVDQTSFIPDAKKLVKDTQASKMEIFNTSRKQKNGEKGTNVDGRWRKKGGSTLWKSSDETN